MTASATPPRSLARLHRFALAFLWTFRGISIAAGLTALVLGFVMHQTPPTVTDAEAPRVALGNVLLGLTTSFALPLLLPSAWLRDRRVLPILALLAVAWLLPTLRGDDRSYGWLLRAVASGVAIALMVFWNIMHGLAKPKPAD